jgi:MtfA peptidase
MTEEVDRDAPARRVVALAVALALLLALLGLLAVNRWEGAGYGEVSSGWLVVALALGAGVITLSALLARDLWLQGWLGRLFGRRRRRRERGPFPEAWELLLRKNVPAYLELSPEEQRRLRLDVQDFLARKRFEGCGGQEITDEVRVTVAGQGCRLLLGWDEHDGFAHVEAVLVYPAEFQVPDEDEGEGEEGQGGPVVGLLGQAVYRGPVILAWDSVMAASREGPGAFNVVLHEFAHQIDFAGQDLADATRPGHEERLRRYRAVMDREYAALVEAAKADRETLLDHYGATDSLEFFAVATEAFFECPVEVRAQHPELYEVLCELYDQRPAERAERAAGITSSPPP